MTKWKDTWRLGQTSIFVEIMNKEIYEQEATDIMAMP